MRRPHDGTFLDQTRRAIAAFRQSRATAVANPAADPLTPVEARDLLSAGPCPEQYRSYFERVTLPDIARISEFQRDLNRRLPAGSQIPVGSFGELNSATREAIAIVFPLEGAEGIVTPAVLEALTR